MSETVAAEAILGEDGTFQDGWLGHLAEDTFEKDDNGKLKQGDLADHKNLGSMAKSYLKTQRLMGTAIQPLPEKPTDGHLVPLPNYPCFLKPFFYLPLSPTTLS